MYKTASQIADAVLQKVALSPGLVSKVLNKHVFDFAGKPMAKGLEEVATKFPRALEIARARSVGTGLPSTSRGALKRLTGVSTRAERPWATKGRYLPGAPRNQYRKFIKEYMQNRSKISPEMDAFMQSKIPAGKGVTGQGLLKGLNPVLAGKTPQRLTTTELPAKGMLGRARQWWDQRSGVEKGLLGAGAGLGAAGLGYGGYQAMSGPSEEEQY